jgi:hypothetical protein
MAENRPLDERLQDWAHGAVTALDDPAEPGSPLESATRSWSLWNADRGIRLTQAEAEAGKRHLKAAGWRTTRRGGDVTRWKGLVVHLPALPERQDGSVEIGVPGAIATDFDDRDLTVGLSALVRSGLVRPRDADLAVVHLTEVPYALCRTCGMLTRNTERRIHVGC